MLDLFYRLVMSFKVPSIKPMIIFAGLLLLSGCEKDIPQPDIDMEIQKLMVKYDLPSIAACVIKRNRIVWTGIYGYSDKENQIPASAETIYYVGSISKLFIATAIMQLEEQGKIDIDEDINNYLDVSIRNPHFPDIPITVRMLMTHTAGIAWPQTYSEALGLWEQFPPDQAPAPSEWVPEFLLPSGAQYNPLIWKNTKPSTFELYSNIGSNVLAYLVEQISGQNFREYCRNEIFLPLNMHNTSYNYADLDASKVAVLYRDDNRINPPFDDRIYASGGLKTNIMDLSRFLIAYLNRGILENENTRILQSSTIQRMLEIQNNASGTGLLWKASFGNWWGHTGGLEQGAASILEMQKSFSTGLIIFCNKHHKAVYQGNEIYELVRQRANRYLNL